MKVALVHEYLTQHGGAERVLDELVGLWPEAPVYTLVLDQKKIGPRYGDSTIRTSFLSNLPFGVRHYQFYLGLMPRGVESFDLSDFNLVISSSSSFAKGIKVKPGALHICYCHTPTRYLWGDTDSYIAKLKYPWLLKAAARGIIPYLRRWDKVAARRPGVFVANSLAIRDRIRETYGREAEVVYPPVEIARFKPEDGPKEYFLAGGRLMAYKRFDLIIAAFNRLKIPLKIFGTGPAEADLRKQAKKNIEFLGFIPDVDLPGVYARAIAYIHPQEEDFGIAAVEAMAAGRPVIAWGVGGAKETVVEGVTGLYFDEQSWEAIADVVIRFDEARYRPEACRAQAEKFSPEEFRKNFSAVVQRVVTEGHGA